MTVGVGSWMPELRRDPLLKCFRDEVLQLLGFVIRLIYGIVEPLEEKRISSR